MTLVKRIVQWFKNLRLARKLILINCILIVIPLGVISIFSFSSFTKTLENTVGNYQLQTLHQLSLNIDTYMDELNRLSLMPYQYQDILNYLGSSREPGQPLTLEEIGSLNSFVAQVFMNGRVDMMGISLFGEKGASYVVLPESQYVTSYKLEDRADWLREIEGQFGKPIFMSTHEVTSTRGTPFKVFSIARELRNFDSGKKLGYIVIDIDPNKITQFLLEVSLGDKESLYIVDRNGDLVIGTEDSPHIVDLDLSRDEVITQISDSGEKLLVAHVTSPITEWTTVSVVPVRELMKASYVVRNSIVLIGALCIALAIIFTVIIVFRITMPLRILSRLMKNVERGDLKVSFPVQQWDEVGHLGNSFNMMVSKLNELGYWLYESEIREKNAQIAALQSKINPHFLNNTLGSISMYAEVAGNREIVIMTNNLGKLLRYSLGAHTDQVTLWDELEHVRGYMAIQKLRYEDRLNFDIEIEEAILDFRFIPLTIQPIVENAIIHGIDKGVGEGKIQISGKREGDILRIVIEDDGIGLTNEQLINLRLKLEHTKDLGGVSGNGLLNVHRRIRLHYGDPFGLQLESMPFHGLKVSIILPVKHDISMSNN